MSFYLKIVTHLHFTVLHLILLLVFPSHLFYWFLLCPPDICDIYSRFFNGITYTTNVELLTELCSKTLVTLFNCFYITIYLSKSYLDLSFLQLLQIQVTLPSIRKMPKMFKIPLYNFFMRSQIYPSFWTPTFYLNVFPLKSYYIPNSILRILSIIPIPLNILILILFIYMLSNLEL